MSNVEVVDLNKQMAMEIESTTKCSSESVIKEKIINPISIDKCQKSPENVKIPEINTPQISPVKKPVLEANLTQGISAVHKSDNESKLPIRVTQEKAKTLVSKVIEESKLVKNNEIYYVWKESLIKTLGIKQIFCETKEELYDNFIGICQGKALVDHDFILLYRINELKVLLGKDCVAQKDIKVALDPFIDQLERPKTVEIATTQSKVIKIQNDVFKVSWNQKEYVEFFDSILCNTSRTIYRRQKKLISVSFK